MSMFARFALAMVYCCLGDRYRSPKCKASVMARDENAVLQF